jgi:hypothetical protein
MKSIPYYIGRAMGWLEFKFDRTKNSFYEGFQKSINKGTEAHRQKNSYKEIIHRIQELGFKVTVNFDYCDSAIQLKFQCRAERKHGTFYLTKPYSFEKANFEEDVRCAILKLEEFIIQREKQKEGENV